MYPSLVAVSAFFRNDLVDYVPGVYPALEVGADGLYVTPESLNQFIVALGLAVLVVPEEFRGLVMPAEGVSHHEHIVLYGKVHIPVGPFPIPDIRPGMKGLRLQFVARGKCIEVLEDQVHKLRITAAQIKRADCGANLEGVFIYILQGRCLCRVLRLTSGTGRKDQRKRQTYFVNGLHLTLFKGCESFELPL